MTFESQNDYIYGTPTLTRSIIILPPLQNGFRFSTQKFNLTYIGVLEPTYCLPWLVVPLVVFESLAKEITAQIHSIQVAIQQKSIKNNRKSWGFFTQKIMCYLEMSNLQMYACHEGHEVSTDHTQGL